MPSHADNLACVIDACFKATGVDTDDVFYDPTLPDVLLALGNLGGYTEGGSFYVSHWGDIERVTPMPGAVGQNRHEKVCEIDLRTGLSGWSEEAVAALANLLKPND